jgi:dienelactone hydrolase
MKRILSVILSLMLILPALAFAAQADPAAAPQAVVEMLYAGEFQQVFDQSTPDVQAALGSADGFAAAWAQVAQIYGPYENIVSATAAEQGGYLVGLIACSHEYADITYSVALDADGLLAGISMADVRQKAPASTADSSLFVAEPITLRAGEKDESQGLLTLPNGDGPFPAVIMMQGSGATDMNESAYGMAPFRDLAEGLAQLGVASIRYDKYPFAHADMLQADPELLASLTAELEYIHDAQAALNLLKADKRIGDIYLLGHSQGAILLPRIMKALGAENLAGGVMIAGTPLPLWEIQYHQNLAVIQKEPESVREAKTAELDAEKAKLEQIQTMTDEELKQTTFFDISAYYQKDQLSVDAAQTAIELQKPLLIVQGGKDWQVTPADGIEAWQAALDGKLAVTYKLYPDMTHMLFDLAGESAGDMTDYHAGSTVLPALIDDVAAWILGE